MKIAFNPSTVAALTAPPNNKDITFDLRGQNIFARGVKFCGTDTNTWRDIKINNVSIGSNILDLRNGSNTTLTNANGVVTINSTWRPVVDNLTSNSTTSSLSANQGRILAGLINGKSDSDHNHDDRYLKLTGGTMLGALNFANGTWNLVGDDSYVGDCNVSGHFGIKAANTTYPGIAFWNSASTFLGNLTAYSGNIKYGAYSLQFLDNGNTSVSASTWTNPFSNYNSSAVADGQAICVWGQSSYLSNLANDSGDMSLWLRRGNAKLATLNMVLDGEYYANGNQRLAHVSEIPTSLKNPHALTISLNGTSQGPYDGSAAKNINITPGSIGAATSGHNHDDRYLKLTGGTMNGNARIDHGSGNLYIGNSGNDGWLAVQDICSQNSVGDGIWSIRTNGTAHFQNIIFSSNRCISQVSDGSNSPLKGIKLPNLQSNGIGIFSRVRNVTDEGGIVLSEDTCVIYNSFDTGWGISIRDKDLNQTDISGDGTIAFGVRQDHRAYSLGGFEKSGSNNSYVLLGGGGHKAVSDFATSTHTHGLLHSDLTVTLANTTADSGWSMINSSYNGFLLKSIRTQGSTPNWIENDYAAGICFGGSDTKGVVSVAYSRPYIKFAGGNGSKPVWWIRLSGISGATYNLANFNADTLDGVHLNGIFTGFSYAQSRLTATIGTVSRTVNVTGSYPSIGGVTMNTVASYGNCMGMAALASSNSNVNPNNQTSWHHFINMSYNTESTNMWQTQFAIKAGTTEVWVRSRAGGSISDSSAWAAPWVRLARITDNVSSTSKLQTPRSIWGQSFDGTRDVNGTIYINNSDSSNGAIRLNNNVNSNARISAIGDQVIFNTGGAIRFGGTSWDFNQWAGLKYAHSAKTIYLGLADKSIFNANSAQSGGTLNLRAGISNIHLNSGTSIIGLPTDSSPYNSRVTLNDTSISLTTYGDITMQSSGPGTIKLTTGYGSSASISSDIKIQSSRDIYLGGQLKFLANEAHIGHDSSYSDPWGGLDANFKFGGVLAATHIYSNGGFHKNGSSDSYVLLGGGGHKTLNDFSLTSHNHDGRYVRAFGTSNDNINSDWGQSFKTFDPIPSGTPPEQNPNISILNIGENFNRRKQLAFIWNNDNIYYRRHTESGFTGWKRLAFVNDINNYYWANVKVSTSSSTTTSPTVSNLTATSSIRMSNILLEHTDEINNSTNGGIHLNYRNSGNVSLCQGGGNVGIGTTTPSYKLDVSGQMRAGGFHHGSVNSDNYILLAGGGYKSFGGDNSHPIFLGYLNLDHGDDGTVSSSFYCLGYSVSFTYTRGGNYCRITISDTTRLSFYINAAIASVNYSGGGMDTWAGYHRGTGAWWLHCYAFGQNEVRVKGFRLANDKNDSWWGGNPLWSGNDGANRITVCIFGYVRFK